MKKDITTVGGRKEEHGRVKKGSWRRPHELEHAADAGVVSVQTKANGRTLASSPSSHIGVYHKPRCVDLDDGDAGN